MAPGLPSGSMCGSEMPMCFSTFPFVFSSLCVDATVTVFQGVRPAVTSSPGQSQAIRSLRACWAHLYLLCLFSIPFIHHPSACPQGSRPPHPHWTPDLRAGVPCHPFANGDITFQLLKFKPDECCSWSEGWPLTTPWPGHEGSSGSSGSLLLGADGSTLLSDSGVLALSRGLIMSADWCSSLHLANG